MKKDKIIKELNGILKGEQIAVGSYGRYIEDVKDKDVKDEFLKIQDDHKKHIEQLSQRIQALGGKPELNTGFLGFMAEAKMAIRSLGKNETIDILESAYDGEDKGIAMVEEIKKGDLDKESAEIVNNILSEDHDHLKKMAHMIANYEYED